jgi:ribonucleotide monophosphatase NagD (HAD superfamily)
MQNEIAVSPLGKTWVLDLDGTVVKHNGYLLDGQDSLLPGVKEFLSQIREEDMVIFVTSRTKEQSGFTEAFLNENEIRFDAVIYGAPYGERILVNDKKPSGLCTAIALSPERDRVCDVRLRIDDSL